MRKLATAILPALALCLPAQARPNLVVLLVDDMGWRDTGFAGNEGARTPNLDRLARSGIIFTEAYAAAPNCASTRACLMTGQYTPRHGVYTVVDERHTPGQPGHRILASPSKPEMDSEAITVAELLKDGGYATAMAGMWNLGRGRRGPRTPTGQGFDSCVQPKDLGFERDEFFNAEGEYLTDRLTDCAIEFVKKQREAFFLYLAFHAVHAPFDPKPELLEKYGSGETAEYAATVEAVDQNAGRLAEVLPADTILFFTSDNGGTRRFVEPLRGGKGTLYEGGLRVPAFATGAGIAPNQKSVEPISTIDIFPTLIELADVSAPAGLPVDGKSLCPLWSGGSLNREALFWHFPCYAGPGAPSSAMRRGNYKLIEFFETGSIELYDLDADPGEEKDLSGTHQGLAAQLYERLRTWQAEMNAPRPVEPNPDFDPGAVKGEGRDQRGKEGRRMKVP